MPLHLILRLFLIEPGVFHYESESVLLKPPHKTESETLN
jgi:hypothetical protein